MKRILTALLLALPSIVFGQGTIIEGITANKAIVPVQVDANGIVQTNNSGASVGTVTISGAPASGGALPTSISGAPAAGGLLPTSSIMVPFQPLGQTKSMTANTSGNIPSPIQASPTTGNAFQYLIWNQGVNLAYVSYATTSATATTNCTVPPSLTVPVAPNGVGIVITLPYSAAYFCAITNSGTSEIDVTPGTGG